MYHANVNVNLIKENVIQIKNEITINVDASLKNIYVKNIIFRILLYVVVKMEIFSKYYWWFSNSVWWNYRRGC